MPVYGGRRTRAGGALERGGHWSRAGRTLERGGACSRGSGPSSGAEPARGKRIPSNGTKPARGDLREGRLGGPLRSLQRGLYPARLGKVCWVLLQVLSGDFSVAKGDP
jgi:hypothetical protein